MFVSVKETLTSFPQTRFSQNCQLAANDATNDGANCLNQATPSWTFARPKLAPIDVLLCALPVRTVGRRVRVSQTAPFGCVVAAEL